jgi:carnitine O-acetyltransferase
MLGRRAVAAQSGYMAKAVNAHGVDRHLLGMINIINHKGLRLSIKPNEAKPSIFTDPSFARSCHWNISTSQITSEYYDTWGWGEVVPDGYGIAYMIKDNCLHFNLTSLFLKNDVMEAHIHSAVEEMRVVFEATIPPKAKL